MAVCFIKHAQPTHPSTDAVDCTKNFTPGVLGSVEEESEDFAKTPVSKPTDSDRGELPPHSPEPGSPKDSHGQVYSFDHLSPAEAPSGVPFSRMMRVRVSIASMTSNRSWHQGVREDGVELMTSVDRAEPESGSSSSSSKNDIDGIGRGIPGLLLSFRCLLPFQPTPLHPFFVDVI